MIKMTAMVVMLSFAPMHLVYGVGIGDLLVESHLDQALIAQVPLHDMGSVQVDDIRVRLAAVEDFEQAAIDFSDFLANLRFKIIKNAKNDAIIIIKSDLPVQEPYIHFILEISWGSGKLLKEFSAFIDPLELQPLPVSVSLPEPGPDLIPELLLEPVRPPSEVPIIVESPITSSNKIKPLQPVIKQTPIPLVVKPKPVVKTVSIPLKPLQLLSPTAKPESLNQRLVMIEEILDTLAQNNKMLKEKQNAYQAENQSLVDLLKMKEQEIIQLKMLSPPANPANKLNLLSIIAFGIAIISILISLIFLLKLKKKAK